MRKKECNIKNLGDFLTKLGWGVRFDQNQTLELFFLDSKAPIYRSKVKSNHFDFQLTLLKSECNKHGLRWISRLKKNLICIAKK